MEWMDFLDQNSIPFAIRVRFDMTVTFEDGRTWSLATLLPRQRARQGKVLCQGRINGTAGSTRQAIHLAANHLGNGQWLILATNRPDPERALSDYRKRWGIECLFGDAKTCGLDIEDTHITDPEKLASLIVIVMLAVTWACRCATTAMGMKAIQRKSHRRRQKSWFRIGFDALRDWIANQPTKAAQAWAQSVPRSALTTQNTHESCTVFGRTRDALAFCSSIGIIRKTECTFRSDALAASGTGEEQTDGCRP